MIRAAEPYYKRRLRELRECGLAMPRPKPVLPRAACFAKLVAQCCDRFGSRLREARDAFVFWVPSEERIVVRKVQRGGYSADPPLDAVLVGRYRYPRDRERFVEDLVLAIQRGKTA